MQQLIEDIASWGHTDIILKTDGEPSIVALQEKIAELRQHKTIPENPPAYTPQANGVAERAVQEFTAQMRCIKLALEKRIGVPINKNWQVINVMAEHASYIINRCLKGADGKTPFQRLKGYESSKPLLEFGEQVWAKPLRTKEWNRRVSLESRWIPATWVGVNVRTGEHLTILPDGGALIRVRTVKRRPIDERWNSMEIAAIGASLRRPEPDKRQGTKVRQINVNDIPEEEVQKSGVVLGEPVVENPKKQRREFRIMPKMLQEHGKTEGCMGCEREGDGSRTRHSRDCRKRFEEFMESDPILMERTQKRNERRKEEDEEIEEGGDEEIEKKEEDVMEVDIQEPEEKENEEEEVQKASVHESSGAVWEDLGPEAKRRRLEMLAQELARGKDENKRGLNIMTAFGKRQVEKKVEVIADMIDI